MFSFLRSVVSPRMLRPFTQAPQQHQHAVAAAAADGVRGMKVRSSVKLMCDKCSFVRRRGRLFVLSTPILPYTMDLVVSGRPVFASEICTDAEQQQQQQLAGQTVRLTGTLLWYDPRAEQALVADGSDGVLVDTRLLGVGRFAAGQTYQVIGRIDRADRPAQQDAVDVRWSGRVVLRARVARAVDGLDVEAYRRAVVAMRAAGVVE
ncbi:hypothetical protein LPJ53_000701 [Coemansia erecta]|uniref:Ribosomal protein n=1 Tax=Coemansia erecta TaxID=147472 RepID=A0A9W8CVM8_9FUNG|nr:hypothetical protein LPJ53_000701 [Coemansia erecta]